MMYTVECHDKFDQSGNPVQEETNTEPVLSDIERCSSSDAPDNTPVEAAIPGPVEACLADIAKAPYGQKDATVIKNAITVYGYVLNGQCDKATVDQRLQEAAKACDLKETRISDALCRAWKRANDDHANPCNNAPGSDEETTDEWIREATGADNQEAEKHEWRSAYSSDELEKLDQIVFDKSNKTVWSIGEYAVAHQMTKIPFLLAGILKVLCSLPPGTTLDMGLGPIAPNLFFAVLGAPASGKTDSTSKSQDAIHVVTADGTVTEPTLHALGSGEGLLTVLKRPEDPNVPYRGVLINETEVSNFTALSARDGSTARPVLIKIATADQLGVGNKNDAVTIPANSYIAGMCINVQPDKAGGILDGDDDGLGSRIIWAETYNALSQAKRCRELKHDDVPELPTITLPTTNADGVCMFSFPEDYKQETREERAKRTDPSQPLPEKHTGHLRLKIGTIACGIAALAGRNYVTGDDIKRAEALGRYSVRIITDFYDRRAEKLIEENAQKNARYNQTSAVAATKIKEQKTRLLSVLQSAPGHRIGHNEYMKRMNSKNRQYAVTAIARLEEHGMIETGQEESGLKWIKLIPRQ